MALHGQGSEKGNGDGLRGRRPLPTRLPATDGRSFDMSAHSHTTGDGGDFFDTVEPNKDRVLFVLGDIAGRGLEDTASIAADCQEVFRNQGAKLLGPENVNEADAMADLLLELNRSVINSAGGVRSTPTFLGCYTQSTGLLFYINAGAHPGVVRDSDGSKLLNSHGLPLGLFTHLTLDCQVQVMEPGAALVLVSKGVAEVRQRNEEFGIDRIRKVVEKHKPETAGGLSGAVIDAAMQFRNAPSRFGPSLHIPGFRGDQNSEDMTVAALVRRS